MKCSKCGTTLAEGAEFCHKCATPVPKGAEEPRVKTYGKKTVQRRPDERIVDSALPDDAIKMEAVFDAKRGAIYKVPGAEGAAGAGAVGGAAGAGATGATAGAAAAGVAGATGAGAAAAGAATATAGEAASNAPATEAADSERTKAATAAGSADAAQAAAATAATPAPAAYAATPALAEAGSVVPVVDVPMPANFLEMERRRKRRKRIVGFLGFVIIAALVAAVGLEVQRQRSIQETERMISENNAKIEAAQQQAEQQAQEQTQQQEAQPTERPVLFTVNGVNYDTGGTRIPVHVTGTTVTGEEVNLDTFVDANGAGLYLLPGTYSLTVNATPIASTGMLYTIPTEPMDLYIAQGGADAVRAAQAITLLPIDVTAVSEEMIENAYSWAATDADYPNRAAECRVAALNALAEAEHVRQAEAERAARRALRPQLAQEFVSNYFTNVIFTDLNDDSKIMGISNWGDVVMPYVAWGSGLANNIASNPLDGWYVTRSVSVAGQDDTSVTIRAEVASAPDPHSGWTAQGWQVDVKCTFDDDNNIVQASFTTSSGTVTF